MLVLKEHNELPMRTEREREQERRLLSTADQAHGHHGHQKPEDTTTHTRPRGDQNVPVLEHKKKSPLENPSREPHRGNH